MSELATLANDLMVKTKKSDALKIVENLFKEAVLKDAPLSYRRDLARLYSLYLPPTPAKPKSPDAWCRKAVAKKSDVRYYLHHCYSINGDLAATDGSRLHIVRNFGLDDGFYDAAWNRVEEDARFPDFERVIPSLKDRHLAPEMPELICQKDRHLAPETPELICQKYDKQFAYILNFEHGTVAVNKKYLDDALSFMDNPRIYYKSSADSILLVEGDKTAVIMPVRI